MMTVFYVICFFISLGIYAWLYVTDVKRSLCQHVMILIMVISNLGYVATSVATELSEALLAYKIVYLGGCFLPLLYFYTVAELCHINLKKSVMILLLCIQLAIFCLVLTIGYSKIYYAGAKLVFENGSSYLIKDYGPAHALYPASMYFYFLASMIISVIAIRKKRSVNVKEVFYMLLCAGLATGVYFVRMLLHLQMDIMALAYSVAMLGAVIPIYHSNLYTADENHDIIREQLGKVGFISFNRKLRYEGCNQFAADIFTQLSDYPVGQEITDGEEALMDIIRDVQKHKAQLLKSHQNNHAHVKGNTMKIRDRFYDYEIHTVENHHKKCMGFTVELRDETEHYRMMELTERYNEELSVQVEQQTEKIRDIQAKTILGMAQMVESRDLSTGGHVKRTSDVVKIFAEKLLHADMGFDAHFLELVSRSAPMHDLGKIGVDDAILRKQGRFTDEEYDKMKKHAEIGGKMVTDILTGVEEEEFVKIAHNVANYHHEKVNGFGYPEGLSGDNIPMEARIMALADVFDALVSKRCYKEAFSYDKAFDIIKSDAGTHFDADLAVVFLSCRKELEAYYNQCEVS